MDASACSYSQDIQPLILTQERDSQLIETNSNNNHNNFIDKNIDENNMTQHTTTSNASINSIINEINRNDEWDHNSTNKMNANEIDGDKDGPLLLLMIDQYGVAHAPFAQARALLKEHGYGKLKIIVHNQTSKSIDVTTIDDLTPEPVGGKLLCHSDFLA